MSLLYMYVHVHVSLCPCNARSPVFFGEKNQITQSPDLKAGKENPCICSLDSLVLKKKN